MLAEFCITAVTQLHNGIGTLFLISLGNTLLVHVFPKFALFTGLRVVFPTVKVDSLWNGLRVLLFVNLYILRISIFVFLILLILTLASFPTTVAETLGFALHNNYPESRFYLFLLFWVLPLFSAAFYLCKTLTASVIWKLTDFILKARLYFFVAVSLFASSLALLSGREVVVTSLQHYIKVSNLEALNYLLSEGFESSIFFSATLDTPLYVPFCLLFLPALSLLLYFLSFSSPLSALGNALLLAICPTFRAFLVCSLGFRIEANPVLAAGRGDLPERVIRTSFLQLSKASKRELLTLPTSLEFKNVPVFYYPAKLKFHLSKSQLSALAEFGANIELNTLEAIKKRHSLYRWVYPHEGIPKEVFKTNKLPRDLLKQSFCSVMDTLRKQGTSIDLQKLDCSNFNLKDWFKYRYSLDTHTQSTSSRRSVPNVGATAAYELFMSESAIEFLALSEQFDCFVRPPKGVGADIIIKLKDGSYLCIDHAYFKEPVIEKGLGDLSRGILGKMNESKVFALPLVPKSKPMLLAACRVDALKLVPRLVEENLPFVNGDTVASTREISEKVLIVDPESIIIRSVEDID